MADSIAKLAVIITGDAAPLGRATQQGAQFVRQFEAQTTGSLATVGNSAKSMNAAFAVAGGNLGRLTALASLGWVGVLAIGAAAAGKLAFNLAAASDALEVAAGANALDTWAGQFDRVQAAALSIAQTLGRPISEALTAETRGLADLLERIANDIMPEYIRREQELAALAEKRKKLEAEAAKERKEAAERAERAFREAEERAKSAAARITASLRTPAEIFADTIAELNQLFRAGLLNVDTLNRGLDKARADLLEAGKMIEAKSLRPAAAITAAERFTASGQSAIEAARRNAEAQLEVERAQLAAAKRREELIKETNRLLRGKGTGPTLAIAGLNL